MSAPVALEQLKTERSFLLYLIKPSHYDDDGYVVQWYRSDIPSNTMAAINGLGQAIDPTTIFDGETALSITAIDETNTRVLPNRIIESIRDNGGAGMVMLVGVQSNQFPRAVDLARPLREAGIKVVVGGFHVSGVLAMLPEIPADVVEAMDMGISIFAGEAEGRLEPLLQDAWRNELKPMYNYMDDLPGMDGVPTPILTRDKVAKNISSRASFDAGRGCPFECGFCTIINVQGRKSRFRTADDIERILQENLEEGLTKFFITDDNFARNKNWEPIFDRIIEFRERENVKIRLIIQVDTLSHLIPGFVEKAGKAGVNRVFLGMENINPDNLAAAKKRQNRITEYRYMLQAWKSIGAVTYGGYIVGFPHDTPERILRDIEIIKRELPLDLIEFFCLTPLPGSEDHKKLHLAGVDMDEDMNIYDAEHVCTDHALMSREEFAEAYRTAWDAFYTPDHIETVARRAIASGGKASKVLKFSLAFYGCQKFEKIHPLQGGIFRRKYRLDRRPSLPVESPFVFYPRYAWEIVSKHTRFALLAARIFWIYLKVTRDPNKHSYTDLALTPAQAEDMETLEIFNATESGNTAVDKVNSAKARKEKRIADKAQLIPTTAI